MYIWLNFIISSITVILIAYIYPGAHVTGYVPAFFVAIILSGVNCLIGPVQKMLTANPDFLDLWLISIVINMIMVLLVAKFIPGFKVDGYTVAFIFAVIISLIGAGASLEPKKKIYR